MSPNLKTRFANSLCFFFQLKIAQVSSCFSLFYFKEVGKVLQYRKLKNFCREKNIKFKALADLSLLLKFLIYFLLLHLKVLDKLKELMQPI